MEIADDEDEDLADDYDDDDMIPDSMIEDIWTPPKPKSGPLSKANLQNLFLSFFMLTSSECTEEISFILVAIFFLGSFLYKLCQASEKLDMSLAKVLLCGGEAPASQQMIYKV